MRTQQDVQQLESPATKPKARRFAWAYAAAAFVIVVVIGAVAALVRRSGGDEVRTATPAAELPAEVPAEFPMPLPSDHGRLTTEMRSNISGARESRHVQVNFRIPEQDLDAVAAMYEEWYHSNGLDPGTQRFASDTGTFVSMNGNWPPGSDLSQADAGTVSLTITSTPGKTTTVGLTWDKFLISDKEYQDWRREQGLIN